MVSDSPILGGAYSLMVKSRWKDFNEHLIYHHGFQIHSSERLHMKRTHLTLVLTLAFLLIGCTQGKVAVKNGDGSPAAKLPAGEHANPPFEGVHHLMRAKLAHAQAVLEGIATNRMDQVQTNATALANLSELAQWQVHRTMEYGMFSEDFRFNARELARHAKEGNLHAATLDYMQLTMGCVRCHDYMNQAGLVKIDLKALMALDGQ